MHLASSPPSIEALLRRGLTGPVDLLSRLRFREAADDAAHPALAPAVPCTGTEVLCIDAYGAPPIIGPSEDRWARMPRVRHASLEALRTFAQDPGDLTGAGHRSAARTDARLVALTAAS